MADLRGIERRQALAVLGAGALSLAVPLSGARASELGASTFCSKAADVLGDAGVGRVASRLVMSGGCALGRDDLAAAVISDYRDGRTLRIEGAVVSEAVACVAACLARGRSADTARGESERALYRALVTG